MNSTSNVAIFRAIKFFKGKSKSQKDGVGKRQTFEKPLIIKRDELVVSNFIKISTPDKTSL